MNSFTADSVAAFSVLDMALIDIKKGTYLINYDDPDKSFLSTIKRHVGDLHYEILKKSLKDFGDRLYRSGFDYEASIISGKKEDHGVFLNAENDFISKVNLSSKKKQQLIQVMLLFRLEDADKSKENLNFSLYIKPYLKSKHLRYFFLSVMAFFISSCAMAGILHYLPVSQLVDTSYLIGVEALTASAFLISIYWAILAFLDRKALKELSELIISKENLPSHSAPSGR